MGKILKVEQVNRPLLVGEKYLVPCIVSRRHLWDEGNGEDVILYITPVINHPHNDIENGQKEYHYHADYRFIKYKQASDPHSIFPDVINKHPYHRFAETSRPEEKVDGEIEYFVLPVVNETFAGVTPVNLIKRSKLKHKCIYKGKCPHRGHDLSQTRAIDGKITCPLHGLQFEENTGEVINM